MPNKNAGKKDRQPTDPLIVAISKLRPTGADGFEGLLRDLLASLTGQLAAVKRCERRVQDVPDCSVVARPATNSVTLRASAPPPQRSAPASAFLYENNANDCPDCGAPKAI